MTRWIFGLVLALAINLGSAQHAGADLIESQQIQVIDGDTIKVDGMTVHLVGFVAPDTRDALCDTERNLGVKATGRVRELIVTGRLDYSPVICSCPATTLGKWFCNFGRTCGTLKTNDRDIGDILVEEGLAVAYSCSKTGCPKTPNPWCKSSR